MPAIIIIDAMKDPQTVWSWNGGYLEAGTHLGRPYYERDTANGGKLYYLYYHNEWASWFIGEHLETGKQVRVNVKSDTLGDTPETSTWPADKLQKIQRKAKAQNGGASQDWTGMFRDPEFPPQLVPSINRIKTKVVDLCCGEPQWIPGRALDASGDWKLFDRIGMEDLMQGSRLGNCWLIAAIAALTEFPQEVRRVFTRDGSQHKDGKYVLRLYDHKTGAMKDVTIDEFIPCVPVTWWEDEHEPYFAKPNGNELWVLLLEKALAKVFGSYGECEGGVPSTAFRALTGCKEQIMWKFVDGKWKNMALSDGKDGNLNKFNCDGPDQEYFDNRKLFEHVLKCDRDNFMMSAFITNPNTNVVEGRRRDGLVDGHGYTLICATEVTTTKTKKCLRMVQLRNPWGAGGMWTGPWADNDKQWDQNPDVSQKLRPTCQDDGIFWMEWGDFERVFTNVCICHKSMREGQEAHRHSVMNMDWTKFQAPAAKQKPETTRRQWGSRLAPDMAAECMLPINAPAPQKATTPYPPKLGVPSMPAPGTASPPSKTKASSPSSVKQALPNKPSAPPASQRKAPSPPVSSVSKALPNKPPAPPASQHKASPPPVSSVSKASPTKPSGPPPPVKSSGPPLSSVSKASGGINVAVPLKDGNGKATGATKKINVIPLNNGKGQAHDNFTPPKRSFKTVTMSRNF